MADWYVGFVPLEPGLWKPRPDPPTLTPQINYRWLAQRPCAACGKHVEVALYHRAGNPFCGANCSLAWHQGHG